MKKRALLFFVAIFSASLFAFENISDTYMFNNTVLEIEKVSKPYEKGDYIVFTHDNSARSVGIAFDFENYKIIHQFKIRKIVDMNFVEKDAVLFYLLEKPRGVKNISYRLIVDGLWTSDPANENSFYDENLGIVVSHLAMKEIEKQKTQSSTAVQKTVHFLYRGNSGEHIYVTGSFAHWDPWIYEMKETSYGVYELDIALPEGTHYYLFYNGLNSFPDSTNRERAYSTDGKLASVIRVNN